MIIPHSKTFYPSPARVAHHMSLLILLIHISYFLPLKLYLSIDLVYAPPPPNTDKYTARNSLIQPPP